MGVYALAQRGLQSRVWVEMKIKILGDMWLQTLITFLVQSLFKTLNEHERVKELIDHDRGEWN